MEHEDQCHGDGPQPIDIGPIISVFQMLPLSSGKSIRRWVGRKPSTGSIPTAPNSNSRARNFDGMHFQFTRDLS